MSRISNTGIAVIAAALALTSGRLRAQEGPTPTQTLVLIDAKTGVAPSIQDIHLELNGKPAELTGFQPVQPTGMQIAVLIDDGLRTSVSMQFDDIRAFLNTLPPGAEVSIGYMENGRVITAQPFTTDHAAAAASLRIPFGTPGMSASPYFCLSDFVKKWPEAQSVKARFVLMLTNGVDPYNGSTQISNQDSPYVQAAIDDANRAGVAVYSIYYGDSGFHRGGASFSGQSYLSQVADSTGGQTYYEGWGNPVSLAPFLKQFEHAISETYVASFMANANHRDHDLVTLKMTTHTPKLKLRVPAAVRPGNTE